MNPYEVLGVSEDADDETIKRAYRELVKKYHPDKYVNNPLADLAGEKIKEINKAYDMIMNKSHAGGGGNYTAGSSYGGGTHGAQPSFAAVRALISQSRVSEALAMLETLPRTAEWYYLSGCVRLRVGWYDQAISMLRTAVNMEPDNPEYRNALNNVENRNRTYTSNTAGSSAGGLCGPCDCCTACVCADCICPCF